jgi:DNA-binding protein
LLVAQVRITSVNKVRNYISYAVALLEEKGHTSVVLKAMGSAINKAVVVGAWQAVVCGSATWQVPGM